MLGFYLSGVWENSSAMDADRPRFGYYSPKGMPEAWGGGRGRGAAMNGVFGENVRNFRDDRNRMVSSRIILFVWMQYPFVRTCVTPPAGVFKR